MKWKPIKTAPEEIPVLIYDSSLPYPKIGVAEYLINIKGWSLVWDTDSCQGLQPTHWMSLSFPNPNNLLSGYDVDESGLERCVHCGARLHPSEISSFVLADGQYSGFVCENCNI